MELYMQNREHGRMILELVEHDPLIWPTIEENGVTRTKKYAELSAAEKIQADCDMKATNIILQGLPADIYSLVNHHRVAKDLWERVQLLMQGTSLTKQEREYLHTTNFDQLHAYLEQHELHANEVRLLRERNQDPLAFVANQQMTPPHFNSYQSSYYNPQLQQQLSPSQAYQYGPIHQPQPYSSMYPLHPQLNHSSVPPSHTYQSQMTYQTSSVLQIAYPSPQVSTQSMTESSLVDSGLAVPVFSPGDDPIACLNKAMAFLTAVASSREDKGKAILVLIIRVMLQALGETMQVGKQGLLNATTVKVKDIWRGNALSLSDQGMQHDPGVPDAVLMANISNYGSDVISEVSHSETNLNDMENKSVLAMQDFEQSPVVDFTDNEIHIFKSESKEKEDKYMENKIDLEKKIKELDNILFKVGQSAQTVHMLTKPQTFYDNIHKQALGYQNPVHLKKTQRIKPTLYYGIVMFDKHVPMPVIDDEETLILEEDSRSKMSEKEKDPKAIKQNISHKPIDYEKLNRLTEDFGKLFTPQQELSAEQAFWLRMSDPTSKHSDALPVKIKAPKELPKIILVNESLKKLKFHLAKFDNVVKIRTTPNASTEGEWRFEHTKVVFNNEIIPFLKYLKDIFNVFYRDLLNEIMEVQTDFDQMDAAVQQSSVDKQCLEIAKKELLFENDRLLQQIMSQDVLLTVMYSMIF
ncbi:hypothetical protein Tco_1269628 [Tanacetum coccineum]